MAEFIGDVLNVYKNIHRSLKVDQPWLYTLKPCRSKGNSPPEAYNVRRRSISRQREEIREQQEDDYSENDDDNEIEDDSEDDREKNKKNAKNKK